MSSTLALWLGIALAFVLSLGFGWTQYQRAEVLQAQLEAAEGRTDVAVAANQSNQATIVALQAAIVEAEDLIKADKEAATKALADQKAKYNRLGAAYEKLKVERASQFLVCRSWSEQVACVQP